MMSVLQEIKGLTKELYFIILSRKIICLCTRLEENLFACKISSLVLLLSVTSLTRYGLHYNVLLQMIYVSFTRRKRVNKKDYTSIRKTSFHAKVQTQCLHGLPVLT